jgi:hypothetical protein
MFALGLAGIAQFSAAEEPFGSASLLPIPSRYETQQTVTQAGYNRRNYQEDIPSPSDLAPTIAPEVNPIPSPQSPRAVHSHTPTPAPTPMSGQYQEALRGDPWAAGSCSDGSCGTASTNYADSCGAASCGPTIGSRWFVSGGGLIMNRANQSRHSLTQDLNTYTTIMGTENATQQLAGGFEVNMGRLIGCNGCNAVQLTYWGLFPSGESAMVDAPNYPANGIGPTLGTNLNLLEYDNGVNNYDMRTWMTTTTGTHEVRRSSDFNNVEANFLGNSYAWGLAPYSGGPCGCGPRMQYGWLAGFRYFQFNDHTTFYIDYDDTMIDFDDNEFRYRLNTRNSLYGFQMGGQANLALNNCWSLYGSGRAGVFNNHINHSQLIEGSNGYAMISAGNYAGQAYHVNSSRNALAGIGQLDAGVRYNVSCRLSLNAGYRVVGVAGVATSDGQFTDNFADPRQAAYIRADNSVILHGGYFGGTFMW